MLFAVAIFFRVDFFFTAVYFLAAIAVVTRLWTQRVATRIHADRRYVSRAFTGDSVDVDLYIRNESWLPIPWLEITESTPVELLSTPFQSQVVSLGSHEGRHFPYRLQCRKRGYYRLGPLTGRHGDLLDIERREVGWSHTDSMIVYPRVVPLERLGLPTRSALVAVPATTPLYEDASRLMGVRDYRRGDSPRRMHWSASARMQHLVVKQYQPATARETLLALDLDRRGYAVRSRYEFSELAIVVAASLANHMVVRERLPVGFVTEAHDPLVGALCRFALPLRHDRAQLAHILEVLARVQVAEAGGFEDLLRRESVTLPWGATLVAITGSQTTRLAETLMYLRRRGLAVVLVVVDGRSATPELHDLGSAGIRVHHVGHHQDLRIWA